MAVPTTLLVCISVKVTVPVGPATLLGAGPETLHVMVYGSAPVTERVDVVEMDNGWTNKLEADELLVSTGVGALSAPRNTAL